MVEVLSFFAFSENQSISSDIKMALKNRPVFIRLRGLVRCRILTTFLAA